MRSAIAKPNSMSSTESPYTSSSSSKEDDGDFDYRPSKQAAAYRKKGRPRKGRSSAIGKPVKPARAAVLVTLKEKVVKRKKGKGGKDRSAGAPSPESQKKKKVTRASTRKITAKLESDSSKDEIGLEVKKEILDREEGKAKVKPNGASFVTKLVK